MGSAKGSPKTPEKVKQHPKSGPLGVLFYFFQVFLGDVLQTPKKPLFEVSRPEGPETPVNGRLGRKFKLLRICWGVSWKIFVGTF